MSKNYSIVGMNFRKAEEFVAALQPGTKITLVREPENIYDKNAVAVFVEDRHVGYIPKAQNAVLAAFIDQSGDIRSGTWGTLMAQDASMPGNPETRRAIEGKFVRSPNSSYPMVEV